MNRFWLSRAGSASGFSLLEVLVAVAIVGGGIAALGQLVMMAARANVSARATTLSAVLAAQKMEQLRAEAPMSRIGGSIQHDADGFVDYFDAHGRALPRAVVVSFVRRWSVSPLPFEPSRSRVIRVRVLRVAGDASTVPAWPGSGSDESRLLTVVTEHDR